MTRPRKTRVAVLFGGRSSEHAISCLSAGGVLAALDPQRYDVLAIGITADGRWVRVAADPALFAPGGRELPRVPDGAALALTPRPDVGGLELLAPGDAVPDLARVDVVIPLLHGPFGEDGTVQGLLETVGVPYVGSGVLASAACLDKEFMKLLLTARGLPVGPWTVVGHEEWKTAPGVVAARVEALGWPVFVKPARGGSSIGVSRAGDVPALAQAVEEARRYDPKVVVEALVVGREVECGVLGGTAGGPPEASLPAEVRVSGGQPFYDFEAKYLDDATELDVPARLPAEVTAAVRAMAVRAFAALGCAGLARVDFFVGADGALTVNEVNTMPGFTRSSLFPRMWAATGVGYPALVDRLVALALEAGTGLR